MVRQPERFEGIAGVVHLRAEEIGMEVERLNHGGRPGARDAADQKIELARQGRPGMRRRLCVIHRNETTSLAGPSATGWSEDSAKNVEARQGEFRSNRVLMRGSLLGVSFLVNAGTAVELQSSLGQRRPCTG